MKSPSTIRKGPQSKNFKLQRSGTELERQLSDDHENHHRSDAAKTLTNSGFLSEFAGLFRPCLSSLPKRKARKDLSKLARNKRATQKIVVEDSMQCGWIFRQGIPEKDSEVALVRDKAEYVAFYRVATLLGW